MNEALEILLVEDDANDIELTMHVLHQEHISNRVTIARDGEEALDFLFCRNRYQHRDSARAPKLVLLDLKLPKVGGMEVLHQIRCHPTTKNLPVVVLTSSREEEDLVRSYQLGVNSYIQKPVDFEEFSAVIKELGYYWLVVNRVPPANAV